MTGKLLWWWAFVLALGACAMPGKGIVVGMTCSLFVVLVSAMLYLWREYKDQVAQWRLRQETVTFKVPLMFTIDRKLIDRKLIDQVRPVNMSEEEMLRIAGLVQRELDRQITEMLAAPVSFNRMFPGTSYPSGCPRGWSHDPFEPPMKEYSDAP